LVNHFGDASAIFKAKKTLLEKIEGIGEVGELLGTGMRVTFSF
jgi:hypothetical protein